MLSRLGKRIRRFHQTISRSEWAAKYLHLKKEDASRHGVHSPGVLIIQVDGLGYEHFLGAIDRHKMPFLQRLIQRDNFVLRPFYSGLPSTTPAVQAELFYGVKGIIPAFQYIERKSTRLRTMYEAEAADHIAASLEEDHEGLLKGGSSYSNIFSGGAKEAPFCIQSMKLGSLYHGIHFGKIAWFMLTHIEKGVRVLGRTLMEAGLAVTDFFRGMVERRNLLREMRFILSRIGVCTGLLEILRVRVKIDIARGLPIIHANLVGYDEHAHRRGPDSAFAYWSLRGIDNAIRSMVNKAVQSEKRDYAVFIYSDHGQESSIPYARATGKTLHQGVAEAFASGPLAHFACAQEEEDIPHLKLHLRNTGLLRRSSSRKSDGCRTRVEAGAGIRTTAMGPLGHIYLPERPSDRWMRSYARQLVACAAIPLVFFVENDTVVCASLSGIRPIEEKAREIFGEDHPFVEEVEEDMKELCRHPDAGDFVISGWLSTDQTISFSFENGCHGGPGSCETRGFVILPDTLVGDSRHLRPVDLHQKIRSVFNRRPPVRCKDAHRNLQVPADLKVMSYNIHSCTGLDGKLFPGRIARIIGRQAADAVALQEVDRHMTRTGRQDQSDIIAEALGMQYCFFPVLKNDGEEYGLAVLSRYPMEVRAKIYLPRLSARQQTEPRGVLWVRLDTADGPLHLLNTHLSLVRRERMTQMEYIVGENLLGRIPAEEPVVFCGDFNASTSSPAYSLLSQRLSDCQQINSHRRSDPTFFSSYPLLRLDHIFHSKHLAPVATDVIEDWECRLASDHLPITASLMYDHHMANR